MGENLGHKPNEFVGDEAGENTGQVPCSLLPTSNHH